MLEAAVLFGELPACLAVLMPAHSRVKCCIRVGTENKAEASWSNFGGGVGHLRIRAFIGAQVERID